MKSTDWISVKDRLPKIGERVIVYQQYSDNSTFTRMATIVKICQDYRWYDDDGFNLEHITHWQKIVEPKKEKI